MKWTSARMAPASQTSRTWFGARAAAFLLFVVGSFRSAFDFRNFSRALQGSRPGRARSGGAHVQAQGHVELCKQLRSERNENLRRAVLRWSDRSVDSFIERLPQLMIVLSEFSPVCCLRWSGRAVARARRRRMAGRCGLGGVAGGCKAR